MQPRPSRILLSIHPRFAEAIFAGEKRFEYRRSIFRRRDVTTVVMYASRPVGKVVGEFTIGNVLSLKLEELWERTHEGAGIDRSYFKRYFRGRSFGHALAVEEARRYKPPLSLRSDYGINRPPQSFCYLP